ncbi:MAG: hypothetical protein KF726_26520 [Anaerolineae bacterium]|nr:hypothetical protein [Anaerolineae bacterium]
MTNRSGPSRVRLDVDTPFHIDYEWWERDSRDLRATLVSQLLPEQRKQFETEQEGSQIDFIDPDTAEVRRVDALQQAVARAAADSQWVTNQTTLVDAVFRTFLANGNKPLSSNELSKLISKPPITILKTLAGPGGQVYKGIRPALE